MHIFTEGRFGEPASSDVIDRLKESSKVDFPEEYIDFLRNNNGGEGFVGGRYLVFWRAEEICDFNREYEVAQYAPGIVLFGSNGGGEGYGFDSQLSSMPVVRVPFIGMERRYAVTVANGFADFLLKLERSI